MKHTIIILITILSAGCQAQRLPTATPTATAVSPTTTPVPTAIFTPTAVSTPLHTPPLPTMPAPTLLPATPTATPNTAVSLDDTLVLYTTAQNNNWALKTYPHNPALTGDLFDRFYGPVPPMEDVRMYALNFGPQLSPNGRYLLLPGVGGYGGNNTGLWFVNLQTDEVRQLLPRAKLFTWSPYGDRIAYVNGDTLYTLKVADEATPEAHFTHPELWELYARWSPTGDTIATMTREEGELDETGYPELTDTYWLVDIISGQATELAQRPGFAMEHVADEMTWSPTGRYLLVRNELFEISGMNGQPLPTELPGRARWLPFIEQLQAGEQEQLLVNGRSGMTIITINGEEIARITDTFVKHWAFSHNGRFLAYLDPHTETDLILFDLETLEAQPIGPAPADVQAIHWGGSDNYLLLDNGREATPIWALSTQPGSRAQVLAAAGTLIDALPAPVKHVASGTAVPIPTITPADFALPQASSPTQGPVILFARDDDLWRADPNGGQAEPLTSGGALNWGMTQPGGDWRINALSTPPHVSPNGRWLAFSSNGRTLSLVDINNPGERRRIAHGDAVPVWSPDSRYLAYNAEGSLTIYDMENSVAHSLLTNTSQISNVVWSPNMQYIAFACCFVSSEPYNGINFGEIRRVEIATGQVDIVDATTLTVGGGTSPLCWTNSRQVVKQRDAAQNETLRCSNDRSIAGQSPDGTLIASFSPASPDDVYWEGDSLLTIHQTGTNEIVWQRQMSGHATTARWSPDGAAIIFQRGSARENNLSIWRISADGTAEPEPIINAGYLLDVIPQWQQ